MWHSKVKKKMTQDLEGIQYNEKEGRKGLRRPNKKKKKTKPFLQTK